VARDIAQRQRVRIHIRIRARINLVFGYGWRGRRNRRIWRGRWRRHCLRCLRGRCDAIAIDGQQNLIVRQIVVVVNMCRFLRLVLLARAFLPRDIAQTLSVKWSGEKWQHQCEPPQKARRAPCGPRLRVPRSHSFSCYLGGNSIRYRCLRAIDVTGVVRVSNVSGVGESGRKSLAKAAKTSSPSSCDLHRRRSCG